MSVPLSTCPPAGPHRVIGIVGAVGVSRKGFLDTGPDLNIALADCRAGLRHHAEAVGADMVAGCQFQVNFDASTANVTGFGTAVKLAVPAG
ncbi:MAG TPA: hypothetical protein GX700_07355 [Paracoccus sp.]|nr:hypothetical protein [Paracoccus sp. (in: a-proteobacteria)]